MKTLTTLIILFISLNAFAQLLPAHAHNDYLHKKPLYEALEANFRSIEVDVFAVGDSLFVAHNFDKINPGRTFRTLYLEPLQKLITHDNNFLSKDESLILLVDFKNDPINSYTILEKILYNYQNIITKYESGKIIEREITVIISGNRPFKTMQNQESRLAFYDGRINELEAGISNLIMPLVSDNWNRYFTWRGKGEMPNDEKQKLNNIAKQAHENGYMLRFWATPERPEKGKLKVWNELKNAKVDLIGCDDIQGLKEFLTNFE